MTRSDPRTDLRIGPARASDAPAIADLYLSSRAAALPSVQWAHGRDAVHRWVAAVLLPNAQTWIARIDGEPVGFLCLEAEEITQLYVAPRHWRRGVGRALLAGAMVLRPAGLDLRCFLSNDAALRFYRALGFRTVETTDGSENEEREPDALMRWSGKT